MVAAPLRATSLWVLPPLRPPQLTRLQTLKKTLRWLVIAPKRVLRRKVRANRTGIAIEIGQKRIGIEIVTAIEKSGVRSGEVVQDLEIAGVEIVIEKAEIETGGEIGIVTAIGVEIGTAIEIVKIGTAIEIVIGGREVGAGAIVVDARRSVIAIARGAAVEIKYKMTRKSSKKRKR